MDGLRGCLHNVEMEVSATDGRHCYCVVCPSSRHCLDYLMAAFWKVMLVLAIALFVAYLLSPGGSV